MSFALEIVTYIARIVQLGMISGGYHVSSTRTVLEGQERLASAWLLTMLAIILQGQTKLNGDFEK